MERGREGGREGGREDEVRIHETRRGREGGREGRREGRTCTTPGARMLVVTGKLVLTQKALAR
jgi:hypothetical protein